MKKRIAQSIISELEQAQEQNGAFRSFASHDRSMDNAVERETTFATSLILSCLAHITFADKDQNERKKNLAAKAAVFLLEEKSPYSSWNYWQRHARTSKESGVRKIPDDLDDTSCALSALSLFSPQSLDGSILGNVVKLLTLTEQKPGGPYNTWIVDPAKADKAWLDCDPIVNANIAYFLSLQDIKVPGVSELLEKTIATRNFSSKYYESPLVSLYFISRSCRNASLQVISAAAQQKAILYINKELFISAKNISLLEKAMALSALINFGASKKNCMYAFRLVSSGIRNVVNTEEWPSLPLFIETKYDGIPSYAGSPGLTAAFCGEALSLYDAKEAEVMKQDKKGLQEERIHAKVIDEFARKIAISKKLFSISEKMITKVLDYDPGRQITLLPYFFYESILDKKRIKLDKNFIIEAGAMNLAGWIAYKIYDDFMDNEGKPQMLPLANICLRNVSIFYRGIIDDKNWPLFHKMFDDMELANYEERLISCHGLDSKSPDFFNKLLDPAIRIPDFGDFEILSHKSLPHCFGPVAILLHSTIPQKEKEIQKVISFFHHYIIARQLNDDAHDWMEDLEKGFINSIGAKILRSARKKYKFRIDEVGSEIEPMVSKKDLQAIFWNSIILTTSKEIKLHIKSAEDALRSLAHVIDTTYLNSLLNPLIRATDEALEERTKMLEFLEGYKK